MRPDEQHQADRLGAYADAWLDGDVEEPRSAEEATFARLQRVLGTNPQPATTGIFTRQEDHAMSTIPSTAGHAVPRATRPQSPAMAALARWQPAISLTVMLVLLGGMLAIAWDRQLRNPDPTPTMFAALQDEATPATEGCTPPPPSASDEELLSASLSDWDPPVYFARDYADEQTAQEVRAAFVSYLRCGDSVGIFLDDSETITPVIREYFSPRMRYLSLYDSLTLDQRAEIDAFSCRPKEEDVLRYFPMLINNQSLPVAVDGDRYSYYNNSPIYKLGDGRYGMALGRITTETLRNPAEPSARDELGVAILFEHDGHFYIDEYFIVVSADPAMYSYGQMRGDCY
jgi:hypothetical protein